MGKVVEKKEGLLKNLFYVMNDHVPQLAHIHNDHEHGANALKPQVSAVNHITINVLEYPPHGKAGKRQAIKAH